MGSCTAGATFGPADFRRVLGQFPTGVVVVTAVWRGRPAGLAVGSFCSLSLEPPLVLFCVGKTSSSWPEIERAGVLCVNVLSREQRELCLGFARSGGDKFGGVTWTATASGSPALDGALAWLDCRIESVAGAGDHYVVIARVLDLSAHDDEPPLVFCRGSYGHFQPWDGAHA